MNENIELLEYIYKNSEMGSYSSDKLLCNINDKENKIKKDLEDIKRKYEQYKKESKKLVKKNKFNLEKNSLFTKISSSVGIKMEVKKDNSDASIAHLLIQGLTMGAVDIESKINRFEKSADKNIINFAKEYLNFQNCYINLLKNYL